MSARSAGNPLKGSAGTQSQLTLGSAAPPVSTTLSSPGESVTRIATGLELSIDLAVKGKEQWLTLSLEDPLNLTEAKVVYPILCFTLNRSYHLREALVIGVRRLIMEAFDQKLISDYPGELMTVWTSPHESALPTETSSDESTQSLTDMELQ